MLSSYASAHPIEECKRYDKNAKVIIDVLCPSMISIYNKNMGGIDFMDSLIFLYRIYLSPPNNIQ